MLWDCRYFSVKYNLHTNRHICQISLSRHYLGWLGIKVQVAYENKLQENSFYSCMIILTVGNGLLLPLFMWHTLVCWLTVEYDSDDNPIEETIKPMVDGGTEGFKGHARIIKPGVTPCFECTIWLFPPQVKFPLCTLAETPRTAAHCIEYAHLIKWDEVIFYQLVLSLQGNFLIAYLLALHSHLQAHSGKSFDADNPEHMQWVYSEVSNYLLSKFIWKVCSGNTSAAWVLRYHFWSMQFYFSFL